MNFDDAREAVRAGSTPIDAARQVVESMTPDERLWCLDGDAPARAALGFLSRQDSCGSQPPMAIRR